MSAFLGPIHFWLYDKVKLQQNMINEIIQGQSILPSLMDEVNNQYGISEIRPLEEIIDESNIHGWLQGRVSQVEYKLAYSITKLLNKESESLENLKEIFFKNGREIGSTLIFKTPSEAFKAISNCLLDGMPCDHANSIIEENDEKTVWKRNTCVHERYWREVGGDIQIYYQLREDFINGLLSEKALILEKVDEITYRIRRSE